MSSSKDTFRIPHSYMLSNGIRLSACIWNENLWSKINYLFLNELLSKFDDKSQRNDLNAAWVKCLLHSMHWNKQKQKWKNNGTLFGRLLCNPHATCPMSVRTLLNFLCKRKSVKANTQTQATNWPLAISVCVCVSAISIHKLELYNYKTEKFIINDYHRHRHVMRIFDSASCFSFFYSMHAKN